MHTARTPAPPCLGALAAAALALVACTPGDSVRPHENQAPAASITLPATGTLFSGGDTVHFAGTGTDPEDGPLPASRLTWWADLHHDTHIHPFLPRTPDITAGDIEIPPRGHNEENIFLRIYLEVTDAQGAADTAYVDVQPRKVTLSLASVPSGLTVTLDGQPRVTPFSLVAVSGMERDLGAPPTQTVAGDSLEFVAWSDSGAPLHTVVTPSTDAFYTATYHPVAVVNQPPTVAMTQPTDGAHIIEGSTTALTATASDPDGAVVAVEFLDGAASIAADSAAPYAQSWTATGLGIHTLTARATDDSGAAVSSTVTVTVIAPGTDGTPPVVRLTSPTDGTADLSGTVSISADATDDVGVVAVAFQLDGQPLGEDSTAPYGATIPATTAYASGVHLIQARAWDASGNVSDWAAARVTFDGADLPAGFSHTVFAEGIAGPATAMAFAPDGRLFVAEQGGAVRVIRNGVLLPTPFVTVNTSVNGERGLLGLAFHPQFASNGWVYLYYTSSDGGAHNRIVRYRAEGDTAAGQETVLVDLPVLSRATDHNGGALHFGPDGKLYVAVGDNGTGANAQSLANPFGKILRFNDDGTIPEDNPFRLDAQGSGRAIWALGLRNPFTFSFQPGTGRMFINDVGESTWEEVDEGQPGVNFGWPTVEGPGGDPEFAPPLFAYGHEENPTMVVGQAIVGSAFSNPATMSFPPAYAGNYFFADYVQGWINRLDPANANAVYAFWHGDTVITGLEIGPDGALYVLGWAGSAWGVHRISYQ
jgi:glucose/arabinose dehydrogenase